MAEPDSVAPRPVATLAHARARQTRRDIIAAAIKLSETQSFDDVTVDQIIAAASVAKGTFYYHFRRKEDVLVELAWSTVDRVGAETEESYAAGASMLDALDVGMDGLARRVDAMPPGAVARSLMETMVNRREPERTVQKRPRYSFLSGLLTAAQLGGDVAAEVDVREVATVLSYVIARTILDHVDDPSEPLNTRLRRRTRLVLLGMNATYDVPHHGAPPSAGDPHP